MKRLSGNPHPGQNERPRNRAGVVNPSGAVSCAGGGCLRGAGRRFALMRFSVICAVLLAAGVRPAAALDPAEQLQFADGVFARGMWDLALKEYQSVLDQPGSTADVEVVRFRMGECAKALGRAKEAATHYDWVYDHSPKSEYHFRAGLRRAEMMDAEGRLEEKIVMLRGMLQSDPPGEMAAACRYMVGATEEKMGRRADAAATFERVIKESPGSSFVSYAALALGALREQQGGDAAVGIEELYMRAATNPATPRVGAEAWFQLAEFYFRQKQYEKSARAYEKLATAYASDERVPGARLQMAWAFHNAGFFSEALKFSKDAVDGDAGGSKRPEWLYLKANCERQLARNDEAVQTYAALLKQYPDAPLAESAAYERALTFYKMGQFQEALTQARGYAPTARTKRDAYWLLAESCAALKDDAGAIQYYRLLLEQFPDAPLAPDATYRLAHLLQKKGEPVAAAELFSQLVERFPTNTLAAQSLFASAFCYSKAQKHELAVREWTRLLQQYPQSPQAEEATYQKAMSETFLRRDAQSLETWRALLSGYPRSKYAGDAFFWCGVLEEEGGKLEQAEADFRDALKGEPGADLKARAQFRLALVLQRRSKPDESATLLQEALATSMREKFTAELLEWLGNYHLARKAFAPAAAVSDVLLSRTNSEAWAQVGWCMKGKAAEGLGKADEARVAFETAVGLKIRTPAAAESYLRLGVLTQDAGDARKAQTFFEQAAALSASDTMLATRVRAYAGIARALKAQGDLPGAARHFMSVAVLFDDAVLVPECLHEAADAYAKIGRAEESRKVIQELLDRYPDSSWAAKHKP